VIINRQKRMSLRRNPASVPAIVLALAMAGLAGCSSGGPNGESTPPIGAMPTPEAGVRSQPVVPGRPARVFIFAGFGDKCERVASPQVKVVTPPAKGDVTFKPGQETTIQTSAKGTCIGQTAKGTGIYYTARAGQTGTDRFTVTALLATGETSTRTFEVRIAE